MKTIEYLDVVVDRGHTKIPTTIPAYELPVLQSIHDQDTTEGTIEMVQVGKSQWLSVDDDFTPEEAFNSLRRKYDTNRGSPVLQVYKNVRELAKHLEIRDDEPKPRKRQDAVQAAA